MMVRIEFNLETNKRAYFSAPQLTMPRRLVEARRCGVQWGGAHGGRPPPFGVGGALASADASLWRCIDFDLVLSSLYTW
jgi:hypothetical protein